MCMYNVHNSGTPKIINFNQTIVYTLYSHQIKTLAIF